MEEDYRSKLNQFYYQQGIHPLSFKCKHSQECRQFANNGNMTETKMSMVGYCTRRWWLRRCLVVKGVCLI